MTALPREVTQPQRVSATDLPALLAEQRRSGARVVDLIPGHNPVHGADATAAVVLHVDRHYETIWVEGSPLPALELSVASWPEPPNPGSEPMPAPVGFLPIGDGGPITRRRLSLWAAVDGDRIVDVHATSGRLTAGLSRLAPAHPYLQLPVLAEGLNEQTPTTTAMLTVLGIEALAGIDVPDSIQHARVFVAELERVQAHCGWLVSQATACADDALVNEVRHGRERLAWLFVAVCGRRRPTGIHLPGQILIDRGPAEAALSEVTPHLSRLIDTARQSLSGRRGWRRRLEGVGVISTDAVDTHALSGPVARGTGVDLDVRRRAPYLTYDQLDFDVSVGAGGDVVDRCIVRLDEMAQSLRLARQALAAWHGPVQVEDVRVVPPPMPAATTQMIHHFELWMEGHGLQPASGATAFVAVEAPEGELGILLSSDGSSKPKRAHWRSPSSAHFRLLPALLQGQRFADAADVVSSVHVNAAEMDQ
ncbi:MAG: hypothetical protein QGG05_09770 [Candidatus Latescibacteria bacterium]|jgi:NADH-quinone oxidoreductase subunit D|nr:hypothetical protein [Candidatus Latescibacterota bacterium]